MSAFDENDNESLGNGGALFLLCMVLGGGLVRAALTWPAYSLAGLLNRRLPALVSIRVER